MPRSSSAPNHLPAHDFATRARTYPGLALPLHGAPAADAADRNRDCGPRVRA